MRNNLFCVRITFTQNYSSGVSGSPKKNHDQVLFREERERRGAVIYYPEAGKVHRQRYTKRGEKRVSETKYRETRLVVVLHTKYTQHYSSSS